MTDQPLGLLAQLLTALDAGQLKIIDLTTQVHRPRLCN